MGVHYTVVHLLDDLSSMYTLQHEAYECRLRQSYFLLSSLLIYRLCETPCNGSVNKYGFNCCPEKVLRPSLNFDLHIDCMLFKTYKTRENSYESYIKSKSYKPHDTSSSTPPT